MEDLGIPMEKDRTGGWPHVDNGEYRLLIYEGAGWLQKGERLIVPHNVTLLPL
ncbi:MAG: hypothetical protein POH28_15175 [Acidocella sp.]|nr:hypothetical protein [Acidocella sp.]